MKEVLKIKDWKKNRPQFEILSITKEGHIIKVKRLKDGICFHRGFNHSEFIRPIIIGAFSKDCIHLNVNTLRRMENSNRGEWVSNFMQINSLDITPRDRIAIPI